MRTTTTGNQIKDAGSISIFLGFVFLIAALFPIGEFVWPILSNVIFGTRLRSAPPLFLLAIYLLINYLPAAILTLWLLSATKLWARLPTPRAGVALITAGVALTLLFLIARVFAATIEGGGGSYVVATAAPFLVWPARALIAVGIVKLLLSATSVLSPNSIDMQACRSA